MRSNQDYRDLLTELCAIALTRGAVQTDFMWISSLISEHNELALRLAERESTLRALCDAINKDSGGSEVGWGGLTLAVAEIQAERDEWKRLAEMACHRIRDVLADDDGQAWSEGRKFLALMEPKFDTNAATGEPEE
jgi:hypothetical protein